MQYITINSFVKVLFSEIETYFFLIKVKDILPLYYVSVRGKHNEEGAVQRTLNKRRISSIRDFILRGNSFFNTFVLNWNNTEHNIIIEDGKIEIPIIPQSFQVIDGQHRLEGLKEAELEDENVGKKEILVALTRNLTTKQSAEIFLNINSEQKPVPQSLVYDLFGELDNKELHIERSGDIAEILTSNSESPYYNCIKKPGTPSGTGKIDLSTVVNSLKEHLKKDKGFYKYGIDELENQSKVILNYFTSIKSYYDNEGNWLQLKNPFMTNAGFFAATKFLVEHILGKCAERKSFTVETIKKLIPLDNLGLIYKEDIKNLQGKEQREKIFNYLFDSMQQGMPKKNEYEF